MSRKIVGITVGTTLSPQTIKERLKPVLSVNGAKPDDNGNAEVTMNFEDLTEEQKASLKGAPGKDGHTPVKGEDYFTEDDIDQIAEEAAKRVDSGTTTIDSVDASKVVFPETVYTSFEVGNIKLENGIGVMAYEGETLLEREKRVWLKVMNPETTDPEVSLTFSQAKSYEVGTKVTPSYEASLSAGSYTYGPGTGITATAWKVTDTSGNSKTTASGSFPQLTVSDGISYKITAEAAHGAGAIPVTNTGVNYPSGQIPAGTKSKTSSAITGYRKTFYGTLTNKNALTSAIVRGLQKSSTSSLANGSSFTVPVPVGALRVVFAYPATLRDVTSVKDVNGMNAEIASSFVKSTLDVYGAGSYKAISYKVYTLDFAEANTKANSFTVKI